MKGKTMNLQTAISKSQETAKRENCHITWAIKETLNSLSNEELCELASEWADDERIETQIRHIDAPAAPMQQSGRNTLLTTLMTRIQNRI